MKQTSKSLVTTLGFLVVAGAIAGAAFVLGRRAIVDVPTALIALGTVVILVRARRIPEPLVILAAGLIGLGLKGAVGH